MIKILLIVSIPFLYHCDANDSSKKTYASPELHANVELKKIKWIEGKWKGIYNGQPFYEIYELVNDSLLRITSFDWNGKDSSNTSQDFLSWQDDGFYLGNNKRYKVVKITDSEIFMEPFNKVSNKILWKYKDASSWIAVLESAKETREYLMERFDPFNKPGSNP